MQLHKSSQTELLDGGLPQREAPLRRIARVGANPVIAKRVAGRPNRVTGKSAVGGRLERSVRKWSESSIPVTPSSLKGRGFFFAEKARVIKRVLRSEKGEFRSNCIFSFKAPM
jgi:hypothetical protein